MHVRQRFMPYVLAGLLTVSAIAAVAGPVQAQGTNAPSTVEIKITPYQEPIKPLSGFAVLQAEVKYSYFAAGSTALVASKVQLKVAEQPPWAVVTISPSTLLFTIQGTPSGNTVTAPAQKVSIIVTTTADAPAFTAGNLRIQANAEANQPIGPSNAEDQTLIQADFFSILDAQVQQPIRVVGPQKAVDFPVTVSNFGNANTKVLFELASEPSGGLVVPIPQPVTLEARQTGGKNTQQTVQFSIQTPFRNGYLNQPGLANLKLKSAYALDAQKKGEELTLSVLVTTKGFYVPGPDSVLMLAGIAIAAGIVMAKTNGTAKRRK